MEPSGGATNTHLIPTVETEAARLSPVDIEISIVDPGDVTES